MALTDFEQYRLHAYVCGNSCVRRFENMGTVNFGRVFMQCPEDCRYAVVGQYDITMHAERILVWDMWATREVTLTGTFMPPKPLHVGDDLDAAIMATMMQYGEDGQ